MKKSGTRTNDFVGHNPGKTRNRPLELTLGSAFSTGGMVGHLSYLLLVVSMLMRNITWLRLFGILSAFVAILYDVVWLEDPIGVFWETLLVLVNIVQIFDLVAEPQ